MTIKEMQEKLTKLKQEKQKLDIEIGEVEKQILEIKNQNVINFVVDKNNPSLFKYYIVEVKQLKPITFRTYCMTLEYMKELLERTYGYSFNCSFVEADDPITFNKIIKKFEESADLVSENRKRHHDISAAYNNYYNFLLAKRG